MSQLFTRAALYDLVWQKPMTKLAKELGLSDVGLAKACRKAEIPLPKHGHWMRVEAGKKIERVPLPPRGLGKPEEIEFGGSRWGREMPGHDEIVAMDPPPVPTFSEDLEAVTTRARAMVKHVAIPRRLDRPHPAIARLLATDEERRAKYAKSPYSWNAPLFGTNVELRRLRILNALFSALTGCGCQCGVHGKEARDAHVRVGEQSVSFSLEHIGAKERRYNESVEPIPEGAKLCLKVNWWEPPPELKVQWQDAADQKIEGSITDIAVAILVAGEWSYRSWLTRRREYVIERKKELEDRARKERLEDERKERQRLERVSKQKRDGLLADVKAWKEATDIRAFVSAVTAAKKQTDLRWVEWALDEANRLDPLVRKPSGLTEPAD